MKLNQKGFTIVETLIVLVVLSVIAGAGWMVYQRQNSETSTKSTSAITNFEECVAAGNPVMESHPEQCAANGKTFVKESQDSKPSKTDDTKEWLAYQPPSKEYSIRLADGWKLERYQQNAGLYARSNDSLKLQPGIRAIVEQVEGGGDGFGLWLGFAETPSNTEMRGEKTESLRTNEGLEIERYHYAQASHADVIGMAQGGSNYYYLIKNSADKYFEANYTLLKGETDHRDTIEKVLKTVRFN